MCKLAQQDEIGMATADKAVRQGLQSFPYKIRAVQEFRWTDDAKRLHYCESLNNFIERNSLDVLDITVFQDEA